VALALLLLMLALSWVCRLCGGGRLVRIGERIHGPCRKSTRS
jgi:hypothetical protein